MGVMKWIQEDILLLLPLTVRVNKNRKESASMCQIEWILMQKQLFAFYSTWLTAVSNVKSFSLNSLQAQLLHVNPINIV